MDPRRDGIAGGPAAAPRFGFPATDGTATSPLTPTGHALWVAPCPQWCRVQSQVLVPPTPSTTSNALSSWFGGAMTIELNHTIVPAHDKEESARFFARIFGLKYEGAVHHFAPVQVNDRLTLDFDTDTDFRMQHYAFHVSDAEFDAIFGRVKAEGLKYGSGPFAREDGQINHRNG